LPRCPSGAQAVPNSYGEVDYLGRLGANLPNPIADAGTNSLNIFILQMTTMHDDVS